MEKKYGVKDLVKLYQDYYNGEKLITVNEEAPDDGFIYSDLKAGKNSL